MDLKYKLLKIIVLIIIIFIFINGCIQITNEDIKKTSEDLQIFNEDIKKPALTCEGRGGTCSLEGCSGLEFELGLEVSDCPDRCCACCKQIIPECVPAQCCHATECTLVQFGPDCLEVGCTKECRRGTMDCGCGTCELDTKLADCKVIWSDTEGCASQETVCCDECIYAFTQTSGVPLSTAKCGQFSIAEPLSFDCESYFRKNPMTVHECGF